MLEILKLIWQESKSNIILYAITIFFLALFDVDIYFNSANQSLSPFWAVFASAGLLGMNWYFNLLQLPFSALKVSIIRMAIPYIYILIIISIQSVVFAFIPTDLAVVINAMDYLLITFFLVWTIFTFFGDLSSSFNQYSPKAGVIASLLFLSLGLGISYLFDNFFNKSLIAKILLNIFSIFSLGLTIFSFKRRKSYIIKRTIN